MDMNHQFLHRSQMGRIRTTLLDVREGEDWLETDYTFSRAAGKQSLGERFAIGRGKHDVAKGPGHDLMTIRTVYPYQSWKFWTDEAPAPMSRHWTCGTPTCPRTASSAPTRPMA